MPNKMSFSNRPEAFATEANEEDPPPNSPRADDRPEVAHDVPQEAQKSAPGPSSSTSAEAAPAQGSQQATSEGNLTEDKESVSESSMLVEASDNEAVLPVKASAPSSTSSDKVLLKCMAITPRVTLVDYAVSAGIWSTVSPANWSTVPSDKKTSDLEKGEQEEKMEEGDPSASSDSSICFLHTDSKELLKSKLLSRLKGKLKKQAGESKMMDDDSSDSNATLAGEMPTFPFECDSPDRMTPASVVSEILRGRMRRDFPSDSPSSADSPSSNASNSLTGDELRTTFQRDDSGLMSDNAVDSPVQANLGSAMRTLVVGDESGSDQSQPSKGSSDNKPDDPHHFIPVHPPSKDMGIQVFEQSEVLKVGVKRPLDPEAEEADPAASKRRSLDLSDELPQLPIFIQSGVVISKLKPMIEAVRRVQAQKAQAHMSSVSELLVPILPKRKHSSSEDDEAESALKLRKMEPGPSGLQKEASAEEVKVPAAEEKSDTPDQESSSTEKSEGTPEEKSTEEK